MARASEYRGLRRLDEYFQLTHLKRFATSEVSEDLRHDWSAVRPVMQRSLGQIGLKGTKRVKPKPNQGPSPGLAAGVTCFTPTSLIPTFVYDSTDSAWHDVPCFSGMSKPSRQPTEI